MNLVETILDKDGSASQWSIQACLANETVVVDPDQDEGKRSLACNADETGDEKRDLDLLAEQVGVEGRCERSFLSLKYASIPFGFTQTSGLERATRRGLEGKPYR